ncbi:hypothetical protein XENOCAPTIV_003756, partial [Xenoophorus captivus]
NSQNLEEEGELPVPDNVEAPPAGGPEQEQMSDPDGNEPSRDFIQEVPSEESTSRLQVKPSGSGVSSYFDHLSTELEDEGKGEGSSEKAETRKSPTEEKSQSRVRTPCPYGKECYR